MDVYKQSLELLLVHENKLSKMLEKEPVFVELEKIRAMIEVMRDKYDELEVDESNTKHILKSGAVTEEERNVIIIAVKKILANHEKPMAMKAIVDQIKSEEGITLRWDNAGSVISRVIGSNNASDIFEKMEKTNPPKWQLKSNS